MTRGCERCFARGSRRVAGLTAALPMQPGKTLARGLALPEVREKIEEPTKCGTVRSMPKRGVVRYSIMSKIIFRTVSGNVIGVVEKPDAVNPTDPIEGQFVV